MPRLPHMPSAVPRRRHAPRPALPPAAPLRGLDLPDLMASQMLPLPPQAMPRWAPISPQGSDASPAFFTPMSMASSSPMATASLNAAAAAAVLAGSSQPAKAVPLVPSPTASTCSSQVAAGCDVPGVGHAVPRSSSPSRGTRTPPFGAQERRRRRASSRPPCWTSAADWAPRRWDTARARTACSLAAPAQRGSLPWHAHGQARGDSPLRRQAAPGPPQQGSRTRGRSLELPAHSPSRRQDMRRNVYVVAPGGGTGMNGAVYAELGQDGPALQRERRGPVPGPLRLLP
ncbi:unnamed protein product [Prorocentrum cordatum]|uniref:Uncharacterized protein n=1 Tax=Prorocentrum cordatum TaxID=2364126 RepID=A0ABN9TUX4_9DINO|nr:unnamed protein product [Polarella glacialis]